jgi:hypothetical protein
MTLVFGRYKGAPLEEVPTDYLHWLKTIARERLKDAIEEELAARRAERTVSGRPLAELPPDSRRLALAIVRKGYRTLAQEAHPDHGGSTERMQHLNEAHGALLGLVGAR